MSSSQCVEVGEELTVSSSQSKDWNRARQRPTAKSVIEPRSAAAEADVLTTRPTRRFASSTGVYVGATCRPSQWPCGKVSASRAGGTYGIESWWWW